MASPVKSSKGTKYFNLTLQHKSGFSKAVCFDAKKHPQLVTFADTKSPVKVTDYRASKRKNPFDSDAKTNDIILNKLQKQENVPFEYSDCNYFAHIQSKLN